MIAHVVLFQPRADLSPADRAAFAESFERALTGIPHVRRARVGERMHLGRLYDQQNIRDFSYAAIIEFDSRQDLESYLEHPAHQELGRRFYETAEAALVCDFELTEGDDARAVFLRARADSLQSTVVSPQQSPVPSPQSSASVVNSRELATTSTEDRGLKTED